MNTYSIIKAVMLRKGDANYVIHGGAPHKARHPPVEAIKPPGVKDTPAFAHTGGFEEHVSGIPGVGQVYPGEYLPDGGSHGEELYVDESFTPQVWNREALCEEMFNTPSPYPRPHPYPSP
mgnify:CR=1 FL=1